MKISPLLFLSLMLCCCQQTTKPLVDKSESIIVDSTILDTAIKNIQLVSDRYFSDFKTPIEAKFFTNNLLADSIIQPDFEMISWYSSHKDTVDLVAHIGEFETAALLIRFINRKPTVLFFRAPHDVGESKYFRHSDKDSFAHQIEVAPIHYKLEISEIPDTINKQIVFGHIDLETGDYYDKRDSIEQKHMVQMKFYFRSQYKKYDY